MKRMVNGEIGGPRLYQVLYTGEKGEIFFFFKTEKELNQFGDSDDDGNSSDEDRDKYA